MITRRVPGARQRFRPGRAALHVVPVSVLAGSLLVPLTTTAGAAPAAAAEAGAAVRSGAAVRGPALEVFTTHVPALAAPGGVPITGGGFGSALAARPGVSGEFYGLTDRGPNVDAPNGSDKVEPLPGFTPSIGLFRFQPGGSAVLLRRIPLQDSAGSPYSGAVSTANSTSESIVDLSGTPVPPSERGYDPEGLVALRDGTFWVSDEYGPFVTRFDGRGRALARMSPMDGTLPVELRHRVINKGMEGLTVTPDGKTLIGIMQNTLANGISTKAAKKDVAVRIVVMPLRGGPVREYLYLLDGPTTGVSEITALSSHELLVDERDGAYPSATGNKKLWKIDLDGATDIGPASAVPGAVYAGDAAGGYLGLTIGGRSVEQVLDGLTAPAAQAAAQAVGIVPVSKPATPYLDLDALLLAADPTGHFFAHDKIEGVVALDGGRTLVISNDSDFGIDTALSTAADGVSPPYVLHPKITPAGVQDDGEFLVVRLQPVTRTPAVSPA